MDFDQLHVAQPLWLWMLLLMPIVWGLYFFFNQKQQPLHQLTKFIDKHLIPHLLMGNAHTSTKGWAQLAIWSLIWSCMVVALAGPRWNFCEIPASTRDQSLVILLDLSESMNADDIAPSRLGRAKQKIEDILSSSKGVKIGLIAFAADPHMIVPMTEDIATIRHLLPSLETDIVYVQGSKLAPALEMAARMLENESGSNKAIAVLSDGGFEDASAIHTAKKLADRGIVIHAIGIGSTEGTPLKDKQGSVVKKNGSLVVSRLEKEKFQQISKVGRGLYLDADHSQQAALIIEDLEKRSAIQEGAQFEKTQRYWEEHFYLVLLPAVPFFLWWYQRGSIFALILFSFLPSYSQAALSSYFHNTEQQARQAFENENFSEAADTFQDPYRKGVAYYRMGDFAAAEEMFRLSDRPEVASSAAYNVGNALVKQNKLDDAIIAYEEMLGKWPDHVQAKENLELVKKMKTQQQPKTENPSENQSEKENNEDQKQSDSGQDSSDQDSSDQDSPDSEQSSQDQSEEESHKGEDTGHMQPQSPDSEEERAKPMPRSQEDQDADLWLDQIKNDPKSFLKNKFYLESKKNGTNEEVDPW